MNVIETAFNLWYLYLAHRKLSPIAPLVGFTAAIMTLSKTVLYLAQDYFCGYCSTGHNDLRTLIIFFAIPNGFWIVFPTLIALRLSKDIATSLSLADAASMKVKTR
jgi:hypothetical protein